MFLNASAAAPLAEGRPTEQTALQDGFDRAMDGFGGFEPSPHIVVAFSGGADSTALLLLARSWTDRRNGRLTALIVDHGLRRGSGAEARLVRQRALDAGIACHCLRWRGPKPETGLQDAARDARYRLMGDWCRRHGALHLLVGHHRDDQRETIAMRAARRSGADGLAGMAAQRETAWGRVLRPCLAVPRADLRRFLTERQIPWVEDPSNQNPVFERVRVRTALENSRSTDFTATAPHGGDRVTLDRQSAAFLGASAMMSPFGFAVFDHAAFRSLPPGAAQRVTGKFCAAIGGNRYAPRRQRTDDLVAALQAPSFRGRTLAGCRVMKADEKILVVREAGRCPQSSLRAGKTAFWDGRFAIMITGQGEFSGDLSIGPLGRADPRLRKEIIRDSAAAAAIPPAAILALPGFFRGGKLLAAPHLDYGRAARYDNLRSANARFRPVSVVSDAPFAVV